MKTSDFLNRLKPWMLPLAMLSGLFFHNAIEAVAFLAPYLIFSMLFVTFCRVEPSSFRFSRFTWILIAVQLILSVAAYVVCLPLGSTVAQGAFICVFCPTATAAPVITGMLGGSISALVTFSIVSNVAVAVLAPVVFPLIGGSDIGFVAALAAVSSKVVPLIIAPLGAALLLRAVCPRIHAAVAGHPSVSFYLWAISLVIVVGRAVSYVIKAPACEIPDMIMLACAAGVFCVLQFAIGRRIGRRYADAVTGGQGLGQKNTVLAVWMAMTYLNPISSVAPAAYVAWQNSINTLQIVRKQRNDAHSKQ